MFWNNMFKEIDKVISEFVNNSSNKFYINNLSEISQMSEAVFKMQETNTVTNMWSKRIGINESINYVYEFINSFDSYMANQFMNIIHHNNEKNKTVTILQREGREDERQYRNEVDEKGNVYIYYENTPNDIFTIFHEMLHKMNEAYIIEKDGNKSENYTRDYFGEATSIIGESLLGKWLVDNEIITKNDYDIRMKKRLIGSKENARDVLIEAELIKMKLSGLEINEQNLLQVIKNVKNPILLQIFNDESRDFRRMNSIKKSKSLNIRKSQRYVIGQYLSYRFEKRHRTIEDFKKLNYEVGNINANINQVVDQLRDDLKEL